MYSITWSHPPDRLETPMPSGDALCVESKITAQRDLVEGFLRIRQKGWDSSLTGTLQEKERIPGFSAERVGASSTVDCDD